MTRFTHFHDDTTIHIFHDEVEIEPIDKWLFNHLRSDIRTDRMRRRRR
jgi:hypothetical protein